MHQKAVPYKYYVHKPKQEGYFEYLHGAPGTNHKLIVNRCLIVPKVEFEKGKLNGVEHYREPLCAYFLNQKSVKRMCKH